MPTKPSVETINACKAHLDPKAVVLTIINETPELRQAAIDAKIVRELTEDERKALENG